MNINIDRDEQIKLIESVFTAKDDIDKIFDELKLILDPSPECLLFNTMYNLLDKLIYVTTHLVDAKGDWLQWAVWENDCCRKGYEAGPTGSLKPIKSAEDLLSVIEECGEDLEDS